MNGSEISPYPVVTPPCLQEGPTQGIRCNTGRWECTTVNCGYLAIGKEVMTGRETILTLQAEAAKRERDVVIPGFLTQFGAEKLLENDPSFAEDFANSRVGDLYADVRGLHWANNTMGDEEYSGEERGNHLLVIASRRLYESQRGVVRLVGGTPPEDTGEQRQAPETRDVAFRGGERSDELIVAVRKVDSVTLQEIARRGERAFSPEQAMIDSREGRVPLVASISSAHISELGHIERDTPLDEFRSLRGLAARKHDGSKTAQYGRMKELIREEAIRLGLSVEIPREDRDIIAKFYEICCPDFWANPQAAFDREIQALG